MPRIQINIAQANKYGENRDGGGRGLCDLSHRHTYYSVYGGP